MQNTKQGIRCSQLGHITLLKDFQAIPLIGTWFVVPGTALKPAIEFDSRLKENVGLTTPVDPRYVLKTTSPSPYFLKENIVTEALVSFLTSLVNFGSLPVAVDYTSQAGKTGPHMAELFQEHIKTVQVCESCLKKTPNTGPITSFHESICCSFCEECYKPEYSTTNLHNFTKLSMLFSPVLIDFPNWRVCLTWNSSIRKHFIGWVTQPYYSV